MWSTLGIALLVAGVALGDQWSKRDPKRSPPPKSGEKLYFGDIALSPLQKWRLNQTGETFNAVIGQHLRWKDGVIPYTFDCSVENNRPAVEAVRLAMAQWERKTCIRFVKWTDQEFHLTFFRETGCWGNVGQVSYSRISIGDGCEFEHVMAHEIGHVIGLYHEQNRKDRDDWVRVHWENIGQFRDAFEIVGNTDPLGIQYDYESIMHYPWTAFSSNGQITMEPIRPTHGKVPYVEISHDDTVLVSRMYNCPAIEKKRKEKSRRRRAARKPSNLNCIDQYAACRTWREIGHCFVDSVRLACPGSCNPLCNERVTAAPPTEPPTTAKPVTKKPATKKPATKKPVTKKRVTKKAATKAPATKKPVVTAKPVKPTTPAGGKPTVHLPEGWPNRNYLGTGQVCFNFDNRCEEWARWGECKRNPGYMLANCMWSCKKLGFDIYCDLEAPLPPGKCNKPMGLGYGHGDLKIPDSAFSSPAFLNAGAGWTAPPYAARLYNDDNWSTSEIGAWCAASHEPGYIQVDLGEKKRITFIATQGRPHYFERIGTFKIEYGDDGNSFTTYQEHGEDRIFNGNCDHSSAVLNQFNVPFNARFIRYVPWQWNYPCLRMEFYGC